LEQMSEDSLGQELHDNFVIDFFRDETKKYVGLKGHDFGFEVNIKLRFWQDKVDLAPSSPDATC
jgi:hypothetical protein